LKTSNLRMLSILLILAGALAIPRSADAQVALGSIFGIIKDPSGAAIPGAMVTVKNIGTAETRSVMSDGTGQYQVLQLPAGNYAITAQGQGFKTVELPQTALAVGQNARYDMNMEIGATNQTVTVTGEQQLIETTNAAVSSEVTNKQVLDLPLNGRSFVDLAELAPGVVYASGAIPGNGMSQGKGPKIAVNGANTWGNLWYLDGTLMNDNFQKTPGSVAGVTLGVDTIDEFKTYMSTNGAELGGIGGVIDAVTKSGTNSIHGDAFFFLRDKVFDTRDYFDPVTGPPPFVRKQFGGTVGGPVIKNKLFYFFGYEGFRQNSSANVQYQVPNFNEIQTASPIIKADVLPMWGSLLPTACTATTPCPNLTSYDLVPGIQPSPIREDYMSGRLDYNLSTTDTFFVRFTFDQAKGKIYTNTTYLPNFPEPQHTKAEYLTAGYTKVFTPNLVNRALFSYTRPVLDSDEGPTGALPPVSLPGLTSIYESISITGGPAIGANAIEPFINHTNEFQGSDDISYTKGKHTFKFGGNYIHYDVLTSDGDFNSGTWTFSSLPNFLAGIPNTFTFLAEGSGVQRDYLQWSMAGYFSDGWKMTPRITLTTGLRYEYASQPIDTQNRESYLPNPLLFPGPCTFVSNSPLGAPGVPYCPGTTPYNFVRGAFWPSSQDYRDFQPRIGLAWDVFGNGKTVVRPGFGIYDAMILEDFYDTFRYTYPDTVTGVIGPPTTSAMSAACFPAPITSTNAPVPGCPAPNLNGSSRIFVGPIKSPTMYRMSLNIAEQLGSNNSISVGYVGAQGRHLSRAGGNLNLAIPSTVNGQPVFPGYTTAAELNVAGCPSGGCTVAPNVTVVPATQGNCFTIGNNCAANPNFGGLTVQSFDGNSYYNSLQLSAEHRGARFLIQGSYVWSKCVDQGSSTHGSDFSTSAPLLYWANRTSPVNVGLCAFDVRNRFTTNLTYNLPGPTKGALGEVLGGWEVTTNLTLASGSPFTVNGAVPNSSAPYQLSPGGTIFAPTTFVTPGAYVSRVTGAPLILGNAAHFYNPAAIADPVPGYLGNLGRDVFPGPGIIFWNASIIKNFKVTESKALQFRVEAFNLPNHPNLAYPPSTTPFSFAKQANGVQLLTESATAGQVTSTIIPGQGARQLQLGLKLLF